MKLQQYLRLTAVFASFAIGVTVRAEQTGDEVASAIDAHGIKYVARGPVFDRSFAVFPDMIFAPRPEYPHSERARYNEGTAVVRINIDLKTGLVTNASIIRSSGFPKLDEVALNTLQRWRLKPGKWKEAEIPITFTMARHGIGNPFGRVFAI
jgi:TonB family protein